jgi:hypothetical protein
MLTLGTRGWCQHRRGCLLNAYPSQLPVTVVALILTLGLFQPLGFGVPQTQDAQDKQIEVRLIPQKKN